MELTDSPVCACVSSPLELALTTEKGDFFPAQFPGHGHGMEASTLNTDTERKRKRKRKREKERERE
jgi:hypothetical protein